MYCSSNDESTEKLLNYILRFVVLVVGCCVFSNVIYCFPLHDDYDDRYLKKHLFWHSLCLSPRVPKAKINDASVLL